MSWIDWIVKGLPLVAQGIVTVLHISGADRHRTIAGDIAKSLGQAGEAAAKVNAILSNGTAERHTQEAAPLRVGEAAPPLR